MSNSGNTNPQRTEIGVYQQGVKGTGEAVVSAHFMDKLNKSDADFYTAERFAAETLYITPQAVREELIPLLKAASDDIITRRTLAVIEKAKKNHAIYGLDSAADVGLAEQITETLLDDLFRKGPVASEDRIRLRDHIQVQINKDEPVQLAIPMLPHKAPAPVKAKGILPCMAEAGLLARLGEITGIINKLYHEAKPETSDRQMSQFIVVGDGRRFKSAIKESEEVVAGYQEGLKWWVKELGIEQSVVVTDYEYLLDNALSTHQKAERDKHYRASLDIYNGSLGTALDPRDVEGSLQKAIELDPYPDETNSEGRFIPLFKSTIYNIKYETLSNISKLQGVKGEEYNKMYREMTRHLFEPYTDISEEKYDTIHRYAMGNAHQEDIPPTALEFKEYIRRSMLAEAWQSTIEYMALVMADRQLASDPVSSTLPDAVRYSIHAKPGQIGLCNDSSSGDAVQPWHGTGEIRPSKNRIKLSNSTVLRLETDGARPVIVQSNMCPGEADPNDLLEKFAQSGQPLVYVHPSVDFYNTASLRERFTHGR